MNQPHRAAANMPGDDSPPTGPLPESDPMFSDGPSRSKARKSRGVLERVAGRWWQLLVLWLVISVPIAILIYLSVKPTYMVTSLLRIQPAEQDIFGPLTRDDGELTSRAFLKTQVSMILSDKVLSPAVADQNVVLLPTISRSDDPKSALRKNLVVEIVEDTNLIRVGLELSNPDEAVAIVAPWSSRT